MAKTRQYGEWVIKDSAGEGGQSHVFRVEKKGRPDDGVFALKRYLNKNRLDRFAAEIKAAQGLSHPRIIKMVDSDISGPKPYMVMPFYKRGNADEAGISKLPIQQRFLFFRGVLEAVIHAHGNGVIHRDLKPQNILVADDGSPIVADFGICFIADGKRVTLTEEAAGAQFYIAPEAEGGRLTEVAPTLDVYSLGKILYWLLADRHLPRERHRLQEFDLVSRHKQVRYEIVNKLFDSMLAEDPARRIQTANGILDQFNRVTMEFDMAINIPSQSLPQKCIYCGIGSYVGADHELDGASHNTERDAGITNFQGSRLRVMFCDTCGNIQTFNLRQLEEKGRNPWRRTT